MDLHDANVLSSSVLSCIHTVHFGHTCGCLVVKLPPFYPVTACSKEGECNAGFYTVSNVQQQSLAVKNLQHVKRLVIFLYLPP